MATLALVRHGESTFNRDNLFTGHIDAPLTERGREEARAAAVKLKDLRFDRAYCSSLSRTVDSLEIILAALGQATVPVVRAPALDERRYGDLEGLNKAETERKFGEHQVRLWRRGYDAAPPGGESLKDTASRAVAYLKSDILPNISAGKTVLVVAHGNSLRSIVMGLDGLTPEEVLKLDIATGQTLLYDIDTGLHVLRKRVLFP